MYICTYVHIYTWKTDAVCRQTRRTIASIASMETSNRTTTTTAKQRKICNTSIANPVEDNTISCVCMYVLTYSHDPLS
jgi:hypothetical protein